MNEREVQAFLSGLPKHVPQRTAKFRAGQIISDSMHGLSGVGVVESGRVDIYAVALDGRDVQLNSIGAGGVLRHLQPAGGRAAANRSALRGGDDGALLGKGSAGCGDARRRGAGNGLCGAVQREDPVSAFAH